MVDRCGWLRKVDPVATPLMLNGKAMQIFYDVNHMLICERLKPQSGSYVQVGAGQ
jgi:hypothetical protein